MIIDIFDTGAKVTSFVCGKLGVILTQELEKSVRLNKPISDVDANFKTMFYNDSAHVDEDEALVH